MLKQILSKIFKRIPPVDPFFLVILGFEVIYAAYLIYSSRMILHDSFQRFTVQYFFLNNEVIYGEIPQWIPYLTHGTSAAWFFAFGSGSAILSNTLPLVGHFLRNFSFSLIFYICALFDRLILLSGTWLLSRRYFTSRRVVYFVTISVMASSIWLTQPYFNFYFYYAIPLIIYFLHEFVDSAKWRYAFLACNLFAIQIIGNLAYFIPVTSLVISLYFLGYVSLNGRALKSAFVRISGKGGWVGFLVSVILSSIGIAFLLNQSFDKNIVFMRLGRSVKGLVDLNTFLTYGEGHSLFKWMELLVGDSPSPDYTLYIGILAVPFILVGLLKGLNRRSIPIVLVVVILLLFSQGSFVSIICYYCWPLMKFYRHLFYVSPLIRIFLCFMAGFGLERVLQISSGPLKYDRVMRRILIIMAVILLVTAGVLTMMSFDLSKVVKLSMLMEFPSMQNYPDAIQKLAAVLRLASFKICIAIFLVTALAFVKRIRYRTLLVAAVLVFQSVDVISYSMFEIERRTVQVPRNIFDGIRFQAMPFASRRNKDYLNDLIKYSISLQNQEQFNSRARGASSVRFESYKNAAGEMRPVKRPQDRILLFPSILSRGVMYSYIDAFLFNDQLDTPFATDLWQRPLDDFMRAYYHQPLGADGGRFRGLEHRKLKFPLGHPGAEKMSGWALDKIQFFSNAYLLNDRNLLAKVIADPQYTGDVLFLIQPEGDSESARGIPAWRGDVALSANQRLDIPYKILRFDANHLVIEANVPGKQKAWLFYSDVWHPGWRAVVNGRPQPVYKANLAYKAVFLQPGYNHIHFSFYSRILAAILFLVGLNSLFWVICILWIMGRIITGAPLFVMRSR